MVAIFEFFKIFNKDIYYPIKGYTRAKNEVYPHNRVRDIHSFQKRDGRTNGRTNERTTSILLPSEFLRNRRRVITSLVRQKYSLFPSKKISFLFFFFDIQPK